MDYIILALIGFVAALTPGPDIFYVIQQGLCNGKNTALKAVAGILSGNIVYLLLVGVGLDNIGKNLYFQLFIGVIGGLYLLKIAYNSFKEDIKININRCEIDKNVYKKALLINLSNPKAMIFFAVIITPFMSKNIMLSLLALIIGITIAFTLTALISSKIKLENKLLKTINKIAAFIFFIFAIKLFLISFEIIKEIGEAI